MTETDVEELLDLERAGWDALSTGAEDARTFYEGVLDDPVLMLLPGGMVLDDRAAVLDSMGGPAWDSYDLQDQRVRGLGRDAAVVTYGVVAHRGGTPYSALISSTYVRRTGGWKLAVHQQTPR